MSIQINAYFAIKDLDINLSRFDKQLRKMFLGRQINLILNRKRPYRFKGYAPAPNPQRDAAAKIDFSIHLDTDTLLRYATNTNGITVANIPLLLVQKLIAATERQLPAKSLKVSADLDDILKSPTRRNSSITGAENPDVSNEFY